MRLREVIFEASYFDQAVLVLADVPAGYGVYNEWSSTPQLDREPSRRFVTVHNPRPPRSAVSGGGVDVLREVSAADSRTWAIDIANLLREDDTRMRITLAHQPSTLDVLDAVLLDDSEPVLVKLTPVLPRVAQLRYAGATHVEAASVTGRGWADDEHLPRNPDAMLAVK
jgi:hypothetical protein